MPVAPTAPGRRPLARQLDFAQRLEDFESVAVAQGHFEGGGFRAGPRVRESPEGVHARRCDAVVPGAGIVALHEGVFDADRHVVCGVHFRGAAVDECRFSGEERRRSVE